MKYFLFGLALGGAVEALNAACAPGGNFDMRYWNLQLPIGSPGRPTTIGSGELQGCSGYQNWDYFFSQKADGALVMKVPGSPDSAGCVTTPNSKHCRSELREVDPNNGWAAAWDPWQPVNRLFARLSCGQTGGSTVVGQIHIDDSVSSKPVCELYYAQDGSLEMGVGQTRAGGNQIRFPVGNVPPGQVFTYEIRYESNELSVIINGGAKQVLPTFQLNYPRSYFKAGNYLQGSSAASVHFFEIRVQHDTQAIVPAWPPAGSTGPREGLGPFNIMSKVDHTLTSAPPPQGTGGTGGSCTADVPEIASDSTVTLRLFGGSDCCSAVETIKLGQLDSCHNSDADFGSLVQAVGQDMFDRGIKIMSYEGRDCTGNSLSTKLTNNRQCFYNEGAAGTRYKSFKITAAGAPTCSPQSPASVSDTNVALNLFSDSGCCTKFEDIKLGAKNVCHDADNLPTGFKSFTQAVGQSMFGKNIMIVTYSGEGCTGNAMVTKLTNSAACYTNTNSINQPFKSFKISDTTTTSPECTSPKQPPNDSDNTVTLSLFGDTGCCSTPIETSKIGKFGVCHTSNAPFKGTTMTVGQNLFGRNIHVRQYASKDCSNTAWGQVSLSNKNLCYIGSGQYQSYMVYDDAGGSSSSSGSTGGTSGGSTCNSVQPKKKSDTTITLSLYKKGDCCTAVETASIGKLDVCHKADSSFTAIKQAVGQDMFGKGIHIQLFDSDNCSDKSWGQVDLSNKDVCTYGSGPYKSFRIASGSAPATPTNPNPAPPATAEEVLQLELYSDDGCCKPNAEWGIHVPDSGTFSGCLTPNDRFKSMSQGVGQKLFGKNTLIYLYSDKNCASGSYWAMDLSNAKVCDVGAPSEGWGSFRVAVKGQQNSGGSSSGGGSSGGGSSGVMLYE
ncbi:hypothetical protein N0V88_007400 [Collariella sp. IMI 366227]|nr:hypothetical protein N0V88_007400 [Collariella sp. IMI 366227]